MTQVCLVDACPYHGSSACVHAGRRPLVFTAPCPHGHDVTWHSWAALNPQPQCDHE